MPAKKEVEIYIITIAKFDDTFSARFGSYLLIEWKVSDVNLTHGFEHSTRFPSDSTVGG